MHCEKHEQLTTVLWRCIAQWSPISQDLDGLFIYPCCLNVGVATVLEMAVGSFGKATKNPTETLETQILEAGVRLLLRSYDVVRVKVSSRCLLWRRRGGAASTSSNLHYLGVS